jgi:glucose-6-phosphate-specific signal transduction histidine kinase
MKKYEGNGTFTEVSEDTMLGMSIKTLIALGVGLSIAVSAYFNLQAEIEVAKELPEPAVSRVEFELKDNLVRETIMNNAKNIQEIKTQLDKIESRLYEIR